MVACDSQEMYQKCCNEKAPKQTWLSERRGVCPTVAAMCMSDGAGVRWWRCTTYFLTTQVLVAMFWLFTYPKGRLIELIGFVNSIPTWASSSLLIDTLTTSRPPPRPAPSKHQNAFLFYGAS